MLSHSLAKFSARLPSSLKYRLSTVKPLFTGLMRLGQPLVKAQTIAGPLDWRVDELTSQRFLLGSYEPYMQEAFAKHVMDGATVYDVGAHAGFHSLVCGLLVGSEGRVIAFEPNPANCQSIRHQLDANPHLSITVCSLALSDSTGTLKLSIRNGSAQGRISKNGTIVIEARTMDDLVEERTIPPPDVIKIDVEGHERQVLEGGKKTIEKYMPIILCDHNDSTTIEIVQSFLGGFGYKITLGPPITAIPINSATRW